MNVMHNKMVKFIMQLHHTTVHTVHEQWWSLFWAGIV